jgi:hypothetical protein
MLSLRLVRLLDAHAEHLADSLFETILAAEECADLRNVPRDHLKVRSHEIFRNLGAWLMGTPDSELAQRFIALGMERAAQNVALSHFVWAIGATKKTLYDFVEEEGLSDSPIELQGSLELMRTLDRFFDSAIYYAAVGYERYAARLARLTSAA